LLLTRISHSFPAVGCPSPLLEICRSLAVQHSIPHSESFSVAGFGIIAVLKLRVMPSDNYVSSYLHLLICVIIYIIAYLLLPIKLFVYQLLIILLLLIYSLITTSLYIFYSRFPQDALPGNVIGTHFLNSNTITDAVITMIKPFSRSDTFQKVRL
jgi:hypothetical protein